MNIEFPEPKRQATVEVTHGVRMVNGVPHKLEFYNGPMGMRILQINPQRPWVTLLAKIPVAEMEESERFKP